MEAQQEVQEQIEMELDPLNRMMEILEREEPEVEAKETEKAEETEEAEETEIPEEKEELDINGEIRQYTKAELRDLAKRGAEIDTFDQARDSFAAHVQMTQMQNMVNQQLMEDALSIKRDDDLLLEFDKVQWNLLKVDAPEQYDQLKMAFLELQNNRNNKIQALQQKKQQADAALGQFMLTKLHAEIELLARRRPEAKNYAEFEKDIEFAGKNEGYTKAEIKSILDHRFLSTLWKAAQYDKLKASKPEVTKRVSEAPKIVKTKKESAANAGQELREKLKRTGSEEYALKLIESTL